MWWSVLHAPPGKVNLKPAKQCINPIWHPVCAPPACMCAKHRLALLNMQINIHMHASPTVKIKKKNASNPFWRSLCCNQAHKPVHIIQTGISKLRRRQPVCDECYAQWFRRRAWRQIGDDLKIYKLFSVFVCHPFFPFDKKRTCKCNSWGQLSGLKKESCVACKLVLMLSSSLSSSASPFMRVFIMGLFDGARFDDDVPFSREQHQTTSAVCFFERLNFKLN